MATHRMWVYHRYFEMIKNRQKTIEVRFAYPNMKKVRVSDHLIYNDDPENATCLVKRVAEHRTFHQILAVEDASKIDPSISEGVMFDEASKIFPTEKVTQFGLIIFEFEKLSPP